MKSISREIFVFPGFGVIVILAGFLSSLITIIGGVASLIPSWTYVVYPAIGFVATCYLGRMLYVVCKWLNNPLYNRMSCNKNLADFRCAISEILHINRAAVLDDDTLCKGLVAFCNCLKEFFDRGTGAKCSVSIKVSPKPEQNTQPELTKYVNIARDYAHRKRDENKKYQEAEHTLINNTAYSRIFNKISYAKEDLSYINDDIPNALDYENSSKPCHDGEVLPYKSELVYPIIPAKQKPPRTYDLRGFICIDCESTYVFDRDSYVRSLLEISADVIYDLVARINPQSISNAAEKIKD